MKVLAPCLRDRDILFMNEDEAAQVGSHQQAATVAEAILAAGTHTVVLKRGRNGCSIYTAGQRITCAAFAVKPCDTTGAGDSFVAGFLAAHLEGADPEGAGRMGNAVGALCVLRIGAVEGLLPRQQLEQWIAQTPIRNPDLTP